MFYRKQFTAEIFVVCWISRL